MGGERHSVRAHFPALPERHWCRTPLSGDRGGHVRHPEPQKNDLRERPDRGGEQGHQRVRQVLCHSKVHGVQLIDSGFSSCYYLSLETVCVCLDDPLPQESSLVTPDKNFIPKKKQL